MEETTRTNQTPFLIGAIGVVLLLASALIYAALESEARYQPERIQQIANEEIAATTRQKLPNAED